MCEKKPGPRCASDTCADKDVTAAQYQGQHPGGPSVSPLAAVEAELASAQAVVADLERELDETETDAHYHDGTEAGDAGWESAAEIEVRLDAAKEHLASAERAVEVAREDDPVGDARSQVEYLERESERADAQALALHGEPDGYAYRMRDRLAEAREALIAAEANAAALVVEQNAPSAEDIKAAKAAAERFEAGRTHVGFKVGSAAYTLKSAIAGAQADINSDRASHGMLSEKHQRYTDVISAAARWNGVLESSLPFLNDDERAKAIQDGDYAGGQVTRTPEPDQVPVSPDALRASSGEAAYALNQLATASNEARRARGRVERALSEMALQAGGQVAMDHQAFYDLMSANAKVNASIEAALPQAPSDQIRLARDGSSFTW